MIQFFFVFSDWAFLVLRIILGVILVVHGWPKIKNIKKTAGFFKKIGFKPGSFWGMVVALVEFVGGMFLILGFFTQVISLLIFIQFLIILITVKKASQFKGEVEFDLLILAAAAILITIGAGMYSLDHFLGLLLY